MKILFIVREFPKTSETFIFTQVTGLIARGHDVKIVSLKTPKDRESIPELDGRVIWLDYRKNSIRKAAKMVSCTFSGGFSPAFLRYANRVPDPLGVHFYKSYSDGVFDDADAILIHFGDLAHDCAFLSDRLNVTTPVAVVFHGVDVARHLPALPAEERERLWRFMTLGLPVSAYWKERLIELGCPEDKLRVHHMGVDTGAFAFKKRIIGESPRFLSVCRLVPKKGIDTAIEALATVHRQAPDFDFSYDIIGDGPLLKCLEEKAAELGLSERVIFHGRKAPEDARRFFDCADVYMLPSRTAENGDKEGIPVSLMEAMAAGLPVLSTYHSGIPELIEDDVSGLLVDEGDSEGLAAAILRLSSEPELAETLSRGAREKIEDAFNHDSLMADLEASLKAMISKRGGDAD